MKRSSLFLLFVVALGACTLILSSRVPQASAGGFPCFMCHGVHFEGSDIAPIVAGTKLTDEQIANQMRHPRGLMPAFGPDDWPDPQTAIAYIRAQPTGQPTMALSPQQRSAALALIAQVAAARATAVLQTESASASVGTSTPAPSATAAAAPSLAPLPANPAASALSTSPASARSADVSSPFGIYLLGGSFLVVAAVAAWHVRRRSTRM